MVESGLEITQWPSATGSIRQECRDPFCFRLTLSSILRFRQYVSVPKATSTQNLKLCYRRAKFKAEGQPTVVSRT